MQNPCETNKLGCKPTQQPHISYEAPRREKCKIIGLDYDTFLNHGIEFQNWVASVIKDYAQENNIQDYNPSSFRFYDNEGGQIFVAPGPELWPITVEFQYVEASQGNPAEFKGPLEGNPWEPKGP